MNQAWNPYAAQNGYYNGYGGYNPTMQTSVQTIPQQQGLPTFNRTLWVQGYEAAKAVPLSPNETLMLLDSEGDRFYIASAGQDGRPNPLRAFKFVKDDEPGVTGDFVTRKEFDELKAALQALQAPQSAKTGEGE